MLLCAAKENQQVNFAKNVAVIILKKAEEYFQIRMIRRVLLTLIRDNVEEQLVIGV